MSTASSFAAVLARLHEHAPVRAATTAILFVATMNAYWALNASLAPRFSFLTPLDDAVPFLPWTIVVYLSLYAVVFVAALTADATRFVCLFAAVLFANVCCYAGFALLCAHYPRPPLASIPPPWHDAFAMMFASDQPGNTFPSVHVAVAVVVAMHARKLRAAWLAWAALVALSTLTVKQHFVVDVAGGIVVGVCAHALARRSWLRARAGHDVRDDARAAA